MGDSAQTGDSTTKPSRDDLNEKARELGVEDPEGLKNMEAVEEAITDAEADPRYTRDELLDNARSITGQSRHMVAGALHGIDQQTFTKKQAAALAKAFAKREAEVSS